MEMIEFAGFIFTIVFAMGLVSLFGGSVAAMGQWLTNHVRRVLGL